MTGSGLQGTDARTVRAAIRAGDPLPGTPGFAGSIDGRLVRDVLGRYPLFFEADDPETWSFDPTTLTAPERVPAGCIRDETGVENRWTLPAATATAGGVDGVRAAITGVLSDLETGNLAIGFSGGLDSALLAAHLDVPLYVGGFPDSPDVAAAREAASLLDAELRVVTFDHRTLAATVPRVAAAIGRADAMDVQIALALFLVAEHVAADGIDRLAVGQGADELFGGYAKIAHPADHRHVAADSVLAARQEVIAAMPDHLERDVLVLRAAGVEPVVPFVHDDVVRAALDLPPELLVTDAGDRKWALRRAARQWLPDRLAFRPKRAVQYGSRVTRELDRLAREAGFPRRRADHVGRYIRSLLE